VEGSDEVRQVVQALERQYDVVASGRGQHPGGGLAGELPSADELAAEVERFLAGETDGDSAAGDGSGDGDGDRPPGNPAT
jgi:hypothetical protein